MKRFNSKPVILFAAIAIVCALALYSQVNINAPTGLNRGTQQEPERKVETTTPATENKTEATGENNEGAATNPNNAATTTNTATRPRATQQSSQPVNNSAVSAANTEKKPWMNSKKPESLNTDFSTGKNSSNLQSRQEVEMRSYGYRILVYHTNKSKNAKAAAQKRARDISVRFPQYQFYFNYKAPTWRLRLGDFADEEAAYRAMKQLRQAFPLYAQEMTIIHDHINVWK